MDKRPQRPHTGPVVATAGLATAAHDRLVREEGANRKPSSMADRGAPKRGVKRGLDVDLRRKHNAASQAEY